MSLALLIGVAAIASPELPGHTVLLVQQGVKRRRFFRGIERSVGDSAEVVRSRKRTAQDIAELVAAGEDAGAEIAARIELRRSEDGFIAETRVVDVLEERLIGDIETSYRRPGPKSGAALGEMILEEIVQFRDEATAETTPAPPPEPPPPPPTAEVMRETSPETVETIETIETTTGDEPDSDPFAFTEELKDIPLAATAATTDLALDLGGLLRVESFTYLENDPSIVGDGEAARTEIDFALEAKLRFSAGKAVGRFLVRQDFANEARNRLEAEEVYVDVHAGGFEALAGRTYTPWGRASLFNPADVLGPIDARDFLATERLPSWLIRLGYRVGPLLVEAYYLPVFQPDRVILPTRVDATGSLIGQSRWLTGDFPVTSEQGLPVDYRFAPATGTKPALQNAQGAAKASLSLAGFDLSVGYAYLFDPFPSFTRDTVVDQGVMTVSNAVVHHRRHVMTFDVERTFGELRLVAESAAVVVDTRRDRTAVGTLPFVSSVVGADYRFDGFREDDSLRLFADFTVTRTIGAPPPYDPLTRLRFPFPAALFLRAAYFFDSTAEIGLTGVVNVGQYFFADAAQLFGRGPDVYLRPEGKLVLFEHLRAVAGLDILLGGSSSFFGAFKHNTRFTAVLEASF